MYTVYVLCVLTCSPRFVRLFVLSTKPCGGKRCIALAATNSCHVSVCSLTHDPFFRFGVGCFLFQILIDCVRSAETVATERHHPGERPVRRELPAETVRPGAAGLCTEAGPRPDACRRWDGNWRTWPETVRRSAAAYRHRPGPLLVGQRRNIGKCMCVVSGGGVFRVLFYLFGALI